MRTRAKHLIDEEPADTAFRQTLAAFDEPASLAPPPDLVVRTSRRLPNDSPHVLLQRARVRILIRVMLAVLLLAAATFGAWALLVETPTPAPLAIQLVLKPLLGTLGALGLPLLLIGLLAALGSGLLLDRHARTANEVRIST